MPVAKGSTHSARTKSSEINDTPMFFLVSRNLYLRIIIFPWQNSKKHYLFKVNLVMAKEMACFQTRLYNNPFWDFNNDINKKKKKRLIYQKIVAIYVRGVQNVSNMDSHLAL